MTTFVHLAPENVAAAIERGGIRPRRSIWLAGSAVQGVFALPVTSNRFVTYQWQRELRKGGQRTFRAVTFRIPDRELVWIGRYTGGHIQVEAAEAASILEGIIADDPSGALGFEVIIPRKVDRSEIQRIRSAEKAVGWRHFPGAHGRTPCPYPCCLMRGEYGAQNLRERLRRD